MCVFLIPGFYNGIVCVRVRACVRACVRGPVIPASQMKYRKRRRQVGEVLVIVGERSFAVKGLLPVTAVTPM